VIAPELRISDWTVEVTTAAETPPFFLGFFLAASPPLASTSAATASSAQTETSRAKILDGVDSVRSTSYLSLSVHPPWVRIRADPIAGPEEPDP
jgi:hypothetical protein